MKAFKEWEGICSALARGEQSVILRKGGIHEGREGFSFGAEEFLLFPTRFHGQADAMRGEAPPARPEWQVGDEVVITHFARAERAVTLRDWDGVCALEPYHSWTREIVQARYEWEGKGMPTSQIHCAVVRVYELAEPVVLIYEKKHGGCRSWLELGGIGDDVCVGMVPVLDDEAFANVDRALAGLGV